MICKNCGFNIEDTSEFCTNCKSLIKENMTNEVQDQTQKIDFDEAFIKAYIGSKADKMYDSVKNGGFNLWGFLFGIGYFAYRKMYFISIIMILISDIVALFIPNVANYVGMIIGLMFCPLYKWDITRKLRKLKQENPTASSDELLEKAKNKGGTSVLGTIGFLIAYFLILLIIYSIGG